MASQAGFKRNIGLFMAVMIGIGAMMGPGIFALPGELAKLVGPLGVLSYLALGLIVIPTALNYSELGASIPLSGGGYSFVSRLAPKTVAFLTGWSPGPGQYRLRQTNSWLRCGTVERSLLARSSD